MKKIQGVEGKQVNEVEKYSEKKKTTRRPHPKKEAEKQAKSEETSSKKCRYCGHQQRQVRRTECPAFGKTCSECQKKGSVCIKNSLKDRAKICHYLKGVPSNCVWFGKVHPVPGLQREKFSANISQPHESIFKK